MSLGVAVAAASGFLLEIGPFTAKSAIVMEEESGRVVWSLNPDERRYPASTTKIITGLLILERMRPDEIVTAPAGIEKVRGSGLRLKPGETMTAEDTVYAVLLRSANDACEAAATQIAGSVPAFALLMNQRARQAGAVQTNFVNPHGLHDDAHFSTARDLALMAKEAMKNPDFRRVVATGERTITRSMNDKDTKLINRNELVRKDPNVLGVKTGWTNPAGRCFVGCWEKDGKRLITVVLGCKDWKPDQKRLQAWLDKKWELRSAAQTGDVVGVVPAPDGAKPLQAALAQPVQWVSRKDAPLPSVAIRLDPKVKAPIAKGAAVGEAVYTLPNGETLVAPVTAAEEVPKKNSPWQTALYLWPLALLAAGYAAIKMKSAKMKESQIWR